MKNRCIVIFLTLYVLLSCGSLQKLTPRSETKEKCNLAEYKCSNGQCVAPGSICNGTVECLDGSDERWSLCLGPLSPPCKPRSFRCGYGACIDGEKICNGVRDCMDNSDETLPGCFQPFKQHSNCTINQFRCTNGTCIAKSSICNGFVDCPDKSDEDDALCSPLHCPASMFRCRNGACIAANRHCDGIMHCADGSDENSCGHHQYLSTEPPCNQKGTSPCKTNQKAMEAPKIMFSQNQPDRARLPVESQTTGTPLFSRVLLQQSEARPCDLPPQPKNGSWKLDSSHCEGRSECFVPVGVHSFEPGTHIVYSCNLGHVLEGPNNSFCTLLGKWSRAPICRTA